MLKVKNIKKSFGGVKAINGCSFEVKKGTITALIGPNGSGKSTVFGIISGIEKEDEGKVVFGKKDITKARPEYISNAGISRLFQHSNLFNNLTVRENLLLGINTEDTKFWKNFLGFNKTTDEQEKKVKEILKTVDMESYENTKSKNLSYGQKRLVELARAIIKPHQFLMLDEPVAGVNPNMREKIIKILRDLKKRNETILLIEHDMNFTLRIADRIIVLEKGKVIATGDPQKIRNDKRVLDAYLGE